MRQIFLYLTLLSFLKSPAILALDLNHSSNVDAIYGIDDREFVSDKSDPKIQELAKSIGFIISEDYVDHGFIKSTISAQPLKKLLNLCSGEKFELDKAAPGCTGFLVAADIMISAGHCFVTEDDCLTKKIIFDVDADSQSKKGFSVYNKNIFSCEHIISQSAVAESDYAIIKLDRAPRNRKALKLNLTKKIADAEKVIMLGHPYGLPIILSKKAQITDNLSDTQFKASLNSFEGNSGSPVFNAKTFQVEGILVNGQEDLVQDSEKLCYRNAKHVSGGEGVQRISTLPTF